MTKCLTTSALLVAGKVLSGLSRQIPAHRATLDWNLMSHSCRSVRCAYDFGGVTGVLS